MVLIMSGGAQAQAGQVPWCARRPEPWSAPNMLWYALFGPSRGLRLVLGLKRASAEAVKC
jgi:hypothetical protein